jgi:hypothetical protein
MQPQVQVCRLPEDNERPKKIFEDELRHAGRFWQCRGKIQVQTNSS